MILLSSFYQLGIFPDTEKPKMISYKRGPYHNYPYLVSKYFNPRSKMIRSGIHLLYLIKNITVVSVSYDSDLLVIHSYDNMIKMRNSILQFNNDYYLVHSNKTIDDWISLALIPNLSLGDLLNFLNN